MFLLVLAHWDNPGQNPESCKMVVYVYCFCFVRSPADEELWNALYEIPNPDVETVPQAIDFEFNKDVSYDDHDDELCSDISEAHSVCAPSQALGSAISQADAVPASSRALFSSISQTVPPVHMPSPALHSKSSQRYHTQGAQAQRKEFKMPAPSMPVRKLPAPSIPLGKLIRACATHPGPPSYMRPRDRYRERSVSRARDVIVASKRKDAGLPPARPVHQSKFRVPNMQPSLSRHAGGGRNPGLPPPPGDRFRADALASMNTQWLQESIKVSLLTCIPVYVAGWLNSLAMGHFTCDSLVMSSFPAAALLGSNLGQVVHSHMPLCASVTKQFNLVPV